MILPQARSDIMRLVTPFWVRPVIVFLVFAVHAAILAVVGNISPKFKPVDAIEIGIEHEAQEQEPETVPITQQVAPPEPDKSKPVIEDPPPPEPVAKLPVEQPVPSPIPEPIKPIVEPAKIPALKSKPAVMPGLKSEEVATALASYATIVMAKINAAKFYPAAARSSGVAGIVGVQFGINALGKVTTAHVIRSSGNDILDQAALDILRSLELPPPPTGAFSANTNIKFTLMR
jgi:TonB family protein